MLLKPFRLLLLTFFWAFLSGCTLTKIVVHFRPNTTDHERIFTCDTLLGGGAAAPVSMAWTEADGSQTLPKLNQWVAPKDRLQGEDLRLFMRRSQTTAFLVVHNDSLFYEHYANGGSQDRARVVFSVTKALVATLTAIAIEEGKLSLETPVHTFLPEFAKDNRRHIQIQHLLNMTSGLGWNDFQNIWKLGNLYYTSNQARYVTTRVKARHPVGSRFAYQSVSTQILGICLERALEQPLSEYFHKKLWQPLGMMYNGYITLDSKRHRHARTFGGMALTARDMARFGQLMLHEGVWKGQRLVPAWFIEALRTRNRDQWFGYSHSYWRSGYEEAGWKQNQQHWAAGFMGQYIYIAPQENAVVVRQGDGDDHDWSFIIGRLVALLDRGKNDLTTPALDYSNEFKGCYESEEGWYLQLKEMPATDQLPRRWVVKHNLPPVEGNPMPTYLTQFDGVSLGRKKRHRQFRLFAEVGTDGMIEGFYYHAWPLVKTTRFRKVVP